MVDNILTKEEFVSLMFRDRIERITESERELFRENFDQDLDEEYEKIFERAYEEYARQKS